MSEPAKEEPTKDNEKLPTNEMINVLDYITISKNSNWWTAVVLAGDEGRKKVMLYMWNNRNGTWKRLQKFTISRKRDWPLYRDAVEKLLEKIE